MDDNNKLEINEKLYGFNGVIGRHAYFLNVVIICAICALVMLPYTTYIYTHVEGIGDLFNMPKMFAAAPLLLKLWITLGSAGIFILEISNIHRRLSDMLGEVRPPLTVILGIICITSTFSYLLIFPVAVLFNLLNIIIYFVQFFVKGKVTGVLPYDYKKEFNWGAFFGTWIWGLFNKSYIPLWMFLLWLTPVGFYFKLYCGLKGNEWAFKNKGCTDVQAFNESQKNQSIFFTIFCLVILPILYVILILAIIFVLVFVSSAHFKNMTPEQRHVQAQKIESGFNNFMDFMVSAYFERYEIDENENKFYVSDEDWKDSNFKEKKEMLDFAATKSSVDREKEFKKQNPNGHAYFSKTTELPRTKIYSVGSNRLLGEFVMSETKDASIADAFKAALNAYRFYNPD